MKTLTLLLLLTAAPLLQAASGNTVTLAWVPPEPPDDSIVAYVLRYGTESGNYTEATNVGTSLTNQVSGLLPVQHFFVVTAMNQLGLESDPSEELAATPGPGQPPPPPIPLTPPPFNLRFARWTNDTELNLIWDYPVASTNTFYTLYAGTNLLRSVIQQALVKLPIGTNQSCTIRGLSPARKWSFAVAATRFGEESDASNFLSIQWSEEPKPVAEQREIDAGAFKILLP